MNKKQECLEARHMRHFGKATHNQRSYITIMTRKIHNGNYKEPVFKEFATSTFIEILKQKD